MRASEPSAPSPTAPFGPEALELACRAVRKKTDREPALALVLGSGLGDLADVVEDAVRVPAKAIPGYLRSAVEGHKGRLVFGTFAGRSVLFLQGRVHCYEGYDLDAVTFPIRLAARLGATHALITNAAGGINHAFPPGTLMWITGHIDWTAPRPHATQDSAIERSPYDAAWLESADGAARERGIRVERGVYLWTRGPSYETKAEIRAFRGLGADAVGMSTVPEVRAAHAAGLRVLGLSTITNAAAGMSGAPLGHQEVVDTGRRVRHVLEQLVAATAERLGA